MGHVSEDLSVPPYRWLGRRLRIKVMLPQFWHRRGHWWMAPGATCPIHSIMETQIKHFQGSSWEWRTSTTPVGKCFIPHTSQSCGKGDFYFFFPCCGRTSFSPALLPPSRRIKDSNSPGLRAKLLLCGPSQGGTERPVTDSKSTAECINCYWRAGKWLEGKLWTWPQGPRI